LRSQSLLVEGVAVGVGVVVVVGAAAGGVVVVVGAGLLAAAVVGGVVGRTVGVATGARVGACVGAADGAVDAGAGYGRTEASGEAEAAPGVFLVMAGAERAGEVGAGVTGCAAGSMRSLVGVGCAPSPRIAEGTAGATASAATQAPPMTVSVTRLAATNMTITRAPTTDTRTRP
jgi:hypothetical protein